MGLIKAIGTSVSTSLADQWKEFFYCDSLDKEVLVVKGQKRVSSKSQNTKGSDNIISNGSGIAVNDGQAMIIVEQGKIVEFCSEPGQYTFDTSSEPSVFAGNLGKSIIESIKNACRRVSYGGDTGRDQRVYYFNMKEIMENKFGTANPVPFRVVDSKINLDIDVAIRCFGVYSYKIVNPLVFYSNVCGNVSDRFVRSEIDTQLKTEFISALQPAFGELSALEIRPNQVIARVKDLETAMKNALKEEWLENRGIEIAKIALGSVTLPDEDAALIKEAQRKAMYKDPGMAGATLVEAQAEAMKTAAGNANGAMMGFMGLNMATQAGGMNANDFYAMQAQQQAKQQQQAEAQKKVQEEAQAKAAQEQAAANTWTCSCGATVTGKFCPECGAKKPEAAAGWTCSCGTVNKGKFCTECGARKPAGVPLYKCDKCGWEPKDPKNPPRFCPECGDPFNDDDITNK